MDKNAKLMEIFQNEQFKVEAENLTTAEELQSLFSKYGLELTKQEVVALCGAIVRQMNGGELTEDDLEDVAGGFAWAIVGAVALGAACLGGCAGGIYAGVKGWGW